MNKLKSIFLGVILILGSLSSFAQGGGGSSSGNGSGTAGVSTFNSRNGAVTSAYGDYKQSQVSSNAMTGLEHYFTFTEGTGTVVNDFGSAGGTQTITGATTPLAAWVPGGLQLNQQQISIANANGRPTYGGCWNVPVGLTSGAFSTYNYLSGVTAGGQASFNFVTTYGAGTEHGFLAMYPAIGSTGGSAFTTTLEGFAGIHCFEVGLGASPFIVVDGRELSYVANVTSASLVGGNQLTSPLNILGGYASSLPGITYSIWSATTLDTKAQAQARTTSELQRIASLGVPLTTPISNSSANVCAIDGTSIDQGFTASVAPYTLFALSFSCPFNQFAVSGQASKDILSAIPLRAASAYHPKAGKNIILNGGVTNSVSVVLQSPVNAVNDMIAWSRVLRILGYKTIGTTMMDRTTVGYSGLTGSVLKNQVNALLLFNANEFDWLANLAAVPQIGADGAAGTSGSTASSTYFNDGTHVNNAGQAFLVTVEKAAFEGVYGNANPVTITGAYTQVDTDRKIVFTGTSASALTLKDAQNQSFNNQGIVCVKNVGTATLTLTPVNSETINGFANLALLAGTDTCIYPYQASLSASGANWLTQ